MFRKILATVLVVTASATVPVKAQDTGRHKGRVRIQTVIVENVRIYNATDVELTVRMKRGKPDFVARIQPHSSRSFYNLERTVKNTGKDQTAWPTLTIGFAFGGGCYENDFAEVPVTPIEYQVRGRPGQFGQSWFWHHVREWHREPDDERFAGATSLRLVGDVQIRFPGRGDRSVTCRLSDGRTKTFREGYRKTFSIPTRGIYVRFPDGTGRIDGRTIHPGNTYLFQWEDGALRLRTDRG